MKDIKLGQGLVRMMAFIGTVIATHSMTTGSLSGIFLGGLLIGIGVNGWD